MQFLANNGMCSGEKHSFRTSNPSLFYPSSRKCYTQWNNHIVSLICSSNTKQRYNIRLQAFFCFRNVQCLHHTRPQPNKHINKFIAYLSLTGYIHSTARADLAAVSFSAFCIINFKKISSFKYPMLEDWSLRIRYNIRLTSSIP